MTIKEKKRLLLQYNKIEENIELLRRDREKCIVYDTYRSPLGNDSTGGRPDGTVTEITVEKRAEDWEKLINTQLELLFSLRVKIEHAIHSLTNGTEQIILRLHYLGEIDDIGERHCLKVNELAERLGYSERSIRRYHHAALLHLPNIE